MNSNDFEKHLKASLHNPNNPERQEIMQETLWHIKRELHKTPRRERIGFSDFLAMQIKFIGWKVWICQGFLLMLIVGCLYASFGKYLWTDQGNLARLLCYLSVLISMTALPFIHRSIHYKMHEIEATTRFSSVRLLLSKLIIIGIGDIFMLSGIVLIAALKAPLHTNSIILYLMFPFLLSSGGILFLLGHLTAGHFLPSCAGLYMIFAISFAVLKEICPAFFHQNFSAGWIFVCIGLFVFCIYQFRYIAYQSPYAEMQLA